MAVSTALARTVTTARYPPSGAAAPTRRAKLTIALALASPVAALHVASSPGQPAALAAALVVAAVLAATGVKGMRAGDSVRVLLGVLGLAALANVWFGGAWPALGTSLLLGCAVWAPLWRQLGRRSELPHGWRLAAPATLFALVALSPLSLLWVNGLVLCAALAVMVRLAEEAA